MPFTPDPLPWAGTPGLRVSLPTAARLQNMEIGIAAAGNLHRVVHNGTSYAARPTGVAAGLVEYLGPTQPTDWLDKDTWIQTT